MKYLATTVVAIATVAVVLATACGEETSGFSGATSGSGAGGAAPGGSGPGGAGGSGGAGGGASCAEAPDCQSCKACALEGACAAEANACAADPECAAFDDCMNRSNDPSAIYACQQLHGSGFDHYYALVTCQSCQTCATQCADSCLLLHCVNGSLDVDEPTADCGGDDCEPCPLGSACSVNADCDDPGACVDGLCCDGVCGGTCESCNGADTGLADGECHAVQALSDPADECDAMAGIDACNGAGECQCEDGAQNGNESDVDCGGSSCDACPDGDTCGGDADCVSAHCADGVCCDVACNGTCEGCVNAKTNAPDGTCAPVPAQTDPDTECSDQGACMQNGLCDGSGSCALYASGSPCGSAQSCMGGIETNQDTCDGLGNCIDNMTEVCAPYVCGPMACLMSCAQNGDCDPSSYCGGMTCQPKQANGQTCGGDVQCLSGHCADGVCCDTACGGLCEACTQALTGVTTGTCAAIGGGTDPQNECTNQGPCQQNGFCNGIGGCQLFAQGTGCGSPPSCSMGVQNLGDICNGQGSCVMGGTAACAPYVCGPTTCKTSCVTSSDCVGGYYCESNATCQPLKMNGSSCGGSYQCSSGSCVDGFCCNTPCTGLCSGCSTAKTGAPNGTCSFIPSNADPDAECSFDCNGAGACELAQGGACSLASQCGSGFCADGFCCNTACGALCTACSNAKTGAANGTCANVGANTDPDNECATQAVCGQTGSCSGAGACQLYASGTGCGTPLSCAGNQQTNQDTCNGGGSCIDNGTTSCGYYLCNGSICGTSCGSNAQCIGQGYCYLPTQSCEPDQPDGSPCNSAAECQSAHCVDGVCCDTGCTTKCFACNKPGSVGTCTPHAEGTDPNNECGGAAEKCGVTGSGLCGCQDGVQSGGACAETGIDCGGCCAPC
jgi:hypothetical protein